ncbi:MAG: hypothetical protein PHY34_04670 [Patescibacteria group bacterium]|nr:hypothetical protein [Patescibacteria group bacterium]
MPIPVFEQEEKKDTAKESATQSVDKPLTEKVSGFSIFFSILLGIALLLIVEFAFRDGNRLFNSFYNDCHNKKGFHASDTCDLEQYERIRLILHADIAVPLIIMSIFVYFILRKRKTSSELNVILYSYYGFILWLVGRIVAETEYFFLKHHELIGKYLVLFTFILIFVILSVQIQRRFIRKKQTQALK